ncbi:NAD(P)-binding protein [Alteribacillus sp. HJP-4]|uniref:NAD(P)-binding protein n=1 Tax=Alteribacillus sp. HJP-4 TaxID=2775394 RepID=UPI0035CCFE88
MPEKNIIIIGAGPGGLTAGMLLQNSGCRVTIFEKQSYVGGRTSSFQKDGYTFDLGPTFLSMPHLLEEIFEECGRSLYDYVNLKRIEPMYELIFNDTSFFPGTNRENMKKRIQQ